MNLSSSLTNILEAMSGQLRTQRHGWFCIPLANTDAHASLFDGTMTPRRSDTPRLEFSSSHPNVGRDAERQE